VTVHRRNYRRSGPGRGALALALLLSAAAASRAEFRLPPSTGEQSQPVVAADARGGAVIVWREHFPDAAQPLNAIRFQRFDASGQAAGGNQRVDILPGDNARNPAVDMAPDGSFVVVWEGGASEGRTRRTIWARHFNPDGTPRGKELRVNSGQLHTQSFGIADQRFGTPAVSIAPDGTFVIVWRDDGGAHCYRAGISARRYRRDGKPAGGVFTVSVLRRDTHLHPVVGHDAAGGFVIAWQHSTLLGTSDERSDIRARRYGAGGKPRGDVIAIRAGVDRAITPSLAVLPDGSFALAWLEREYDTQDPKILARRFSEDGKPGPVVEVTTEHLADDSHPILVANASGYRVYWSAGSADPWVGTRIWRRSYDAGGQPLSTPRTVGPGTCRQRAWPDAATHSDDGDVVVWSVDPTDVIEALRLDLRGRERATASLAPTVNERWRALLPTEERFPDIKDRIEATQKLGCFRFEAAAAAPLLAEIATGGANNGVKAATLWAQAMVTPDPNTVLPSLLTAARSDSLYLQAGAARGLGVLGLPAAIDVLTALLENCYLPTVRAFAASSLGDIGSRPGIAPEIQATISRTLCHALEVERRADSIDESGPADSERDVLYDLEGEVRTAAAAALARMPSPGYDAGKLIVAALAEDHPVFALAVLGKLARHSFAVRDWVSSMLEDPRPEVRTAAVRCLARLRYPGIGSALQDPSPSVRTAAAATVRSLGQAFLLASGSEIELAARNESDPRAAAEVDAAWLALRDATCADDVVKRTPTPTPRPARRLNTTSAPLFGSNAPWSYLMLVADRSLKLSVRSTDDGPRGPGSDSEGDGGPEMTVWLEAQDDADSATTRRRELEAMSQEELAALVESRRPKWREEVLEGRIPPAAMRAPRHHRE
jgi:HEAT repeat protein